MASEQSAELMSLLGRGVLSEAEYELIFAPESTRALATEILRALREGRAAVVSEEEQAAFESLSDEERAIMVALPDPPTGGAGRPETQETSAETLKRQVSALESELSATAEQLAQARHRKERMTLLEPTSAKEVASLGAYEQKMRRSILAELEACTAAEHECVTAIVGIDDAVLDLLARLDPDGPFLLPSSSMSELSDANAKFLESVQTLLDASPASSSATGVDGDGVSGMRSIAMQELQRLQDLFVNTELDRTDALQMQEESLAIETAAQAQLAQLASGVSFSTQEHKEGRATVEEAVVAKRNDITSSIKQAEKLRKESESALLLELKGSEAVPIKEGDYVLRLAEKEVELQRVRSANAALGEHKLHMKVFETFVADELMGHRQRASAIGASLAQLEDMTQSAPLAARGAAHAATPPENAATAGAQVDKDGLKVLQGLISSETPAAQSAALMSQLVERRLGSSRTRRGGEQEDVVHALLALETRRALQMRQSYDLLWRHANGEEEPIATPSPLAEAVATLQEVRQDLEKRLHRIQQLRATGSTPPAHAHAFVDFFLHPERMAKC